MQDKTILITGATSGIGKETAIALAQKGAHIVFNSRDAEKGKQVQAEIQEKAGHGAVDFFMCDLASLEQVRHFVKQVDQHVDKIDVLINNAGVMSTSKKVSVDGYELNWAVNYLACFLLTESLLGKVAAAEQGRILFVSSMVHTSGKIDLEDPNKAKQGYTPLAYYAASKLAQVVYMKELAQRYKDSTLTANALHPGIIASNIARELPGFLQGIFRAFFNGPEKGAETSIYLASDPRLAQTSGVYFESMKPKSHHALADDPAFRQKLMAASRRQAGIS